MAYSVKVLKDSINSNKQRLTTLEITFPRCVLSEFNTHRMFSRNSSSSRAIPIEKIIKRVTEDPFIPVYWGKNKSGMQATEELSFREQDVAKEKWLFAMKAAVNSVYQLLALNVHKQISNRILEPWMWQTVIVTATEWENFFALRCHPDAQPEIRKAAVMMKDAMNNSTPTPIKYGDWHLPLVDDLIQLRVDKFDLEDIKRISVGRCARVSYLTHDGKRDPKADIELCNKLLKGGHMSPFEHVATPDSGIQNSNFIGWKQFRKELPNESIFKGEVK
jgi:thymidylate synthase ThyX